MRDRIIGGPLIAVALPVFQEIGMTPLVNQSKKIYRLAFNIIADIERERPLFGDRENREGRRGLRPSI
jgi:hypothetical protein